ncbi:zinc-ribbon domain-containing protein [Blastococcus mobilis]|uniref:Zinc-ribbon family protein n=1 Tax=Blastococcus mobilis TaxID=1938746 RepID=A0A239B4Z5_9ACTN|nr:zinc-ribbon domain-containing protein [Blastococcus mobilis]SNS02293.1 zinc-ribbon family protein [Blastococcus mobilis]
MFFLFGFGTKEQDLGPGKVRTCPNCGNTTPWARVRTVKQFTVFFIPIARWGRRQIEICGICGAAVEV